MAQYPAMPLWTDAYLGDTTHLSTIEHGAYLLLLIAMWRKGGSLPSDDRTLAKYTRLTVGQWTRIKPVLMDFFTVEDGRISQGRLTDELIAVRQRSGSASYSASRRWLKTKGTPDASASETQSDGNASISISITTDKNDGDDARERVREALPSETSPSPPEPVDLAPAFVPPPDRGLTHRERILVAIGVDPSGLTGPNGRMLGTQADMAEVGHWQSLGITDDDQLAVISEMMARKRDPGPPSSLRYFTGGMLRLAEARKATPEKPVPEAMDILAMVRASTEALKAKGL
jgi:uncharacterized protein YdaU (DUF1376 family)